MSGNCAAAWNENTCLKEMGSEVRCRSRLAAAGTSVRRRPCHRPTLLNIIYPDTWGPWESVDCGIRDRDSERLAGHDLELFGPRTG